MNAAGGPVNPILDWADLHHYGWLNVPAWVFDLEPLRYRWVNAAGLLTDA